MLLESIAAYCILLFSRWVLRPFCLSCIHSTTTTQGAQQLLILFLNTGVHKTKFDWLQCTCLKWEEPVFQQNRIFSKFSPHLFFCLFCCLTISGLNNVLGSPLTTYYSSTLSIHTSSYATLVIFLLINMLFDKKEIKDWKFISLVFHI